MKEPRTLVLERFRGCSRVHRQGLLLKEVTAAIIIRKAIQPEGGFT
ncbi:hypothetical protein AB1K84_04485 [Mesobacillus foraminis]